jgi:Lon protease-like protein
MPGAMVPLHLFEPRYRAMLRDVKDGARAFGLIMPPAGTPEADLPAGRIGCMAQISAVDMMPDGRANIIITGGERFRFETYLDIGTPYRMGHVSEYSDLPDDEGRVASAVERVQELARRAITASMVLQDVEGALPELPSEPGELSFHVAHMLHADIDMQYEMLAGRSTLTRLLQLEITIRAGLADLEDAADRHARERGDTPPFDPGAA